MEPRPKLEVADASVTENSESKPPLSFFESVKNFIKITEAICSLICLAMAGAIGWYSNVLFDTPTFNHVKVQFEELGQGDKYDRMVEASRACPDSSNTPIACALLYKESQVIANYNAKKMK